MVENYATHDVIGA